MMLRPKSTVDELVGSHSLFNILAAIYCDIAKESKITSFLGEKRVFC
jgi:hypothetical protein